MCPNEKIGGGNKLQPYVPAGHGDKSGEYTNKLNQLTLSSSIQVVKVLKHNCFIKNKRMKCNFMKSTLVQKVVNFTKCSQGTSVPIKHKPNSVVKKIVNGYVVTERYYNNKGLAYLDIDYTDHGRPQTHPEVPHIHKWSKDEHGNIRRQKWESFK